MIELTMNARKLLHAAMNVHRRSAPLDLNCVKQTRPRRSTKLAERRQLDATVKAKETRTRRLPDASRLVDALTAGKVLSACQRSGRVPFAWANWAYDEQPSQSSDFWLVYETVCAVLTPMIGDGERSKAKAVARVGVLVVLAMQDQRYRIFAHQPAFSDAEVCRRCSLYPSNYERDGWKAMYLAAIDTLEEMDRDAVRPVQELVDKARSDAA